MQMAWCFFFERPVVRAGGADDVDDTPARTRRQEV